MEAINLPPAEARDYIIGGGTEPLRVAGKLDLSGSKLQQLPRGLHCYELDASNTPLQALPDDIRIDCRLTLNDCREFSELPSGFSTGSISLRNCSSLTALPEGLETWFLDLSDCRRFAQWPKHASIHNGHLILCNCVSLPSLPPWLTVLSQLDLRGCVQITEIPEGIIITSWVDVGGSSVADTPRSLAGVALRWRGVPVTERIAFTPWEITAQETLSQKNAEIRRVMIERMGYLRFAQEAGAKVIDKDTDPGGPRQLLRIDLKEDEPLVGLVCSCPSTARQYFLRVPPSTKSCHQAAAWIAGYDDPKQYNPSIET